MRLYERLPRRSSGPLGRRFDPVVVQNPLDRVPGDVVAEIRERPTDARVPVPAPVAVDRSPSPPRSWAKTAGSPQVHVSDARDRRDGLR